MFFKMGFARISSRLFRMVFIARFCSIKTNLNLVFSLPHKATALFKNRMYATVYTLYKVRLSLLFSTVFPKIPETIFLSTTSMESMRTCKWRLLFRVNAFSAYVFVQITSLHALVSTHVLSPFLSHSRLFSLIFNGLKHLIFFLRL